MMSVQEELEIVPTPESTADAARRFSTEDVP